MLWRVAAALLAAWVGCGMVAAQGAGPEPAPPADEAEPAATDTVYSETVVVTASRHEESLLDVPVTTHVLTGEMIEGAAADNVADLLRATPGLTVVQSSTRGVDVSARGGGGLLVNSTLAMVDGRSIYLDYIGVVLWDTLPFAFDEIAQVEVQSGPGSAMWGANAINGVINIRTKSPKELKGGLLRLGVGEKGIKLAGVRWADVRGRNSYKISTSYFEQDSFRRDERFANGTPYPSAVKYTNHPPRQPKLDFRLDREGKREGRTWSYQAGVGAYEGIVHSSIGPYRAKSGSYFGYGQASFTSAPVEAKLYYNFLRADSPNLFSPLPSHFSTDTIVMDVTARKPIGEKQLLVYGGTFRHLMFDLEVAPVEDKREEAGVFVEDQLFLGEKVLLTLGARFDWFDTIGTTASPRFSFTLKPKPNHAIRLGFQQAYRAPAVVENNLKTAVFGAVALPPSPTPFFYLIDAVGNTDLTEEHVDAMEVNYTGVFDRRTTFSLTLYRNEVKDNINFVPTQFYSAADPPAGWPLDPALVDGFFLPKTLSYRNFGTVRDQGLEMLVSHETEGGFTTTLTYTYQDEPHVDSQGSFIPLTVNTPPRHQAGARFGFKRPKFWGSVGVSYTDKAFWRDVFDAAFAGWTDSATIVDGLVGLDLPGGSALVFRGTNLLDENFKQHVFGDVIERRAWMEYHFRWE